MKRVYLGLPSRDGMYHYAAATTYLIAHPGIEVTCGWQTSSIVTLNCNALWCELKTAQEGPEKGQYDYFMMLHDDITPQPDWIPRMVAEIESTGADIVSAIIPHRDGSGLTMTGIADSDDLWSMVRRLTLKEVSRLPETFSHEILEPPQIFSSGTGCMIVDARKPWVLGLGQSNPYYAPFQMPSRIYRKDGRWVTQCRSEDETFFRDVQLVGGKVCFTRKIRLQHCGRAGLPNDQVYGQGTDDHYYAMMGGKLTI